MNHIEKSAMSLMVCVLVYARCVRFLARRLVLVAAAFVLLCPCGAKALEPGDAARDFALRDAEGSIVALSDIQRGSVLTVLEMINIYCDGCKSMAGELSAMADMYRDRGVRFVAVALANTPQEVGTIRAAWNMTYPVLADPDKVTMHLYGAARVPQFFIIDSAGIIKLREHYSRAKKLQKKIDELLKAVPAGPSAGDAAPPFELNDQFGDRVAVSFALRNQNTVIGFFGRDDEANRAYVRVLAQQYERYRMMGLRVFAVLPGAFEGSIHDFISENALTFPVLIDRDRDVYGLYAILETPEIIIVNERGRIMRRERERTAEDLQALFATAAPPTQGYDHGKRKTEFLKAMLPGVHMFKPFSAGGETLYLSMDNDGRMLLARFVYKDVMCDVCTDVQYAYTLDAHGIIRHISLLLPFEVYGIPVDARPFISQFIGRRYDEPFEPGVNVDAVTGATLTTNFFIEGLRETVDIVGPLVHDETFSQQFKAEACFLEQAELELALNALRARTKSGDAISIEDLAPLMPGGRIPACPEGGTYYVTEFQAIPRVGCTVHGLDPRSTLIH